MRKLLLCLCLACGGAWADPLSYDSRYGFCQNTACLEIDSYLRDMAQDVEAHNMLIMQIRRGQSDEVRLKMGDGYRKSAEENMRKICKILELIKGDTLEKKHERRSLEAQLNHAFGLDYEFLNKMCEKGIEPLFYRVDED